MISTTYSAEFEIPDNVYSQVYQWPRYKYAGSIRAITEHAIVSGSYVESVDGNECVVEWAEFSTLEHAEEFERRMHELLAELRWCLKTEGKL